MRDSQADNDFEQKKPDKNDYDSKRAFVVQSDTKRPNVETWRGDRSSSNIAPGDAGRPELHDVPHGMFGNLNFAKQMEDK